MKISHSILIALFAMLTFAGAQTTSTFTYSFPYNGSSAQPVLNQYYTPTYQLGVLSVNYSIKVSISFPNGGIQPSLKSLIVLGLSNTAKGLQYIDRTSGSPVRQQAVTTAAGAVIVYPPVTDSITYTFTYTVTFPTAYTQTSAEFLLVFNYPAPISMFNKLYYYTLEATYYPSNQGISVGNANSTSTILKVVDIVRSNLVKLIYVSSANEVFNFTTFPTTSTNFVVNLYADTTTSASSSFKGNNRVLSNLGAITSVEASAVTPPSTPIFVNKVAHYTKKFTAPGYYLVEFQISDTSFFQARVTFNSDAYSCPYDSSFGDFYSTFQGCTQSITPNGLPCASYNAVTGTCALCITGYVLVNGSCNANTTCPPRQYFHFGSCLDVSPTCGAFDAFTGLCLNCSDPANYYLMNGTCLHKAVTCAANQWQTNYTCYNASSVCATFDPNSGKCLTCLSNLYQLNSDGTCTLIVVTCPSGQYAVDLSCVTIPVECLHFDTTLGKCLSCIKGFYVQNGVCQRIVCPNGQVPSNYGIFCVDVSPLCADYDSVTGDCLSCKNSGYTVRNGVCLQESSPLAGCQEREHLGFGPCVDADLNCDTFNLVTGDCDKCIEGYYLDYTGHCAKSSICGAGQWGVNGECIGIPENCLKVDNLGLCTLCLNSNYRLEQGQCVYFHSCQSQQYLNSGGQCIDVSPSCATFNPSNGQCVTCKTAGTQPTSGVCCPAGQVYNSGQCVDGIALQNSYQSATGPSCLIRHPSINICLKCAEGFSPDYTVSYACAQN